MKCGMDLMLFPARSLDKSSPSPEGTLVCSSIESDPYVPGPQVVSKKGSGLDILPRISLLRSSSCIPSQRSNQAFP